jgi:cytochrome c peroxidase
MNLKRSIYLLLPACFLAVAFDTISEHKLIFEKPAAFPAPLYDFKTNVPTEEKFDLGRRLFYDPILSRDSSVSCSSCHQQFAAFAHIDHALSHGIDSRIGTRNVPALQNLSWQNSFMWDGGVNHLEVQAINPITAVNEMNESLEGIILKLQKNKMYKALFSKAYHDSTINSERILKSLAQFTGFMISSNSRYDKYIAGKDTFTIQEKNGLSLFRAKCAGCHTEPLFSDNSLRSNGLIPDSVLNDIGHGKIGGEKDNYKFRVPSLRNIAVTFPYMHDGRFKKLRDVLNHYSDAGIKVTDPEMKKTADLSDKERKDIIAFLLTLTDKEFLSDPRFSDPFITRAQ